MSSNKRASLSSNSPLDQLFTPSSEREDSAREERTHEERTRERRPAQTPLQATGPGAPAPHVQALEEETAAMPEPQGRELRQTTIMIYGDQSDWLDEACYRARRDGGNIISKAAIIRALVDMAREDDAILVRLGERLEVRDWRVGDRP